MWVVVVAPLQILLAIFLVHLSSQYCGVIQLIYVIYIIYKCIFIICSALPGDGMVHSGGHWSTGCVFVAVECVAGKETTTTLHAIIESKRRTVEICQ